MQAAEYSDADLITYLDGGLDQDSRLRLESAMASDPDLAGRIGALAMDTHSLRDGFDALLAEAPKLHVPEVPARYSRPGGWAAVAAVALFAIGLGAGWTLSSRGESETWHQAVADYQVLYTTETLSATPLGPQAKEAGLANASTRIGLKLTQDLLAVEGMTFQRAQVLSFEGAPLIQVAYLTDKGAPVAFCIMRQDGSNESQPSNRTIAGLSAAVWEAGEHAFILIGPVGEEQLQGQAQTLAKRLSG